jgi:hypothetical protein
LGCFAIGGGKRETLKKPRKSEVFNGRISTNGRKHPGTKSTSGTGTGTPGTGTGTGPSGDHFN